MNKKILYMGAVFVILLIIFIISRVFNPTYEKIQYFVTIDTSKVDLIHIVSPDNGEITLKLTGEEWRLTDPLDFRADQNNIRETLKKITEMAIENLVSSREDQRSSFEVDSSGVLFELGSKGKTIASFVMGKSASTYRHTYFRKTKSPEIYMISGTYKYYFNRALKDWRDKIIVELDKETVESFTFKYPDQTISVTLEDTLWMADDGKERIQATRRSVDPLLNYLMKLRAADFYDLSEGEKAPDFSQSDCVLEITCDGGKQITLMLLKQDEEGKKYYIKRSDSEVIYLIYQGTAKILMKNMEDFQMQDTQARERGK